MKRRKPIPEQGHREAPGDVPAVVKCLACYEQRLKDQPWRHPCSRADKPFPPKYLGGEDVG